MPGRATARATSPTARPRANFNPVMATAGRVTVAEVEHLVKPGAIDPDHIHTPGIFVKRIVPLTSFEKPIEQRTVRRRGA